MKILEDRKVEGDFPFAKLLLRRNGPHEVRYVPPPLFARFGLVWDKAHPWAKRLSWQTQRGRVESLAFLSILRVFSLCPRHAGNRSPAARNRFFRILLDIHGHTWP